MDCAWAIGRMNNMGFFVSLLIIIAIQTVISVVLNFLGVPSLYVEMIVNFVLAFLFSFWNFMRIKPKKEIIKDISFHVNVCIWFAVLTGISCLGYMLY